MSQLQTEDIERLASLVKIEITDTEKESFLKDINGILGHISMIQNLKFTQNFEVEYDFTNISKNDNLQDFDFNKNVLMKNIKDVDENGSVRIHKVIKK
jgi:aspartyl/glutamyl-tRNA(Asn/Gln) amidotransferase C subunit